MHETIDSGESPLGVTSNLLNLIIMYFDTDIYYIHAIYSDIMDTLYKLTISGIVEWFDYVIYGIFNYSPYGLAGNIRYSVGFV